MNRIKNYESELYERSGRPIEGIEEPWLWIKGDGGPGTDGGAWVGPREDWIHSHSQKFFTRVKKFDVVIQAGGNLGIYPRLLASRFKTVYTFEPDPLNFHCLVNNCQLDNIVKINAALGTECGPCRLIRNRRENVGMHRVEENKFGTTMMLSIDSLNFEQCDMICLDTEGFEEQIIEGALETIRQFGPVITAENKNGSNIEPWLKDIGYEIVDQSVSDTIFAIKE